MVEGDVLCVFYNPAQVVNRDLVYVRCKSFLVSVSPSPSARGHDRGYYHPGSPQCVRPASHPVLERN